MNEQITIPRFKRALEQDRVTRYGPEIAWRNEETKTILFTDPALDPNRARWLDKLFLLFTDQAEYYAVCGSCYGAFIHLQWSGSTRSRNWRQESREYLDFRLKERAWCQFCDPIFGNGGWIID